MNFSVIGGDLRLVNLAEMLANDKHNVYTYGIENYKELDNRAKKCDKLEEAINKSDIVISSIPFSKKENEVFSVYSEKPIYIQDLVRYKYKDKIFIAGSIKEKKLLEEKYGKVIDIMQNEELTVLNTIATAEGAINVAINNTDTILQGSNVLILGFGRVGKIVAKKFHNLDAKVTCAARKAEDRAWIKTFGYEAVNIGSDLSKYDIIINTVPYKIIREKEMQNMKLTVLLIDLASAPGGIDEYAANKLKIKHVWALALPGKVAPKSSAEFLKQVIYKSINS